MTAAEVSSPFIPTPGSQGKHSFAGINVEKADRKLIPESLELKQDVLNHIKSDIYPQNKLLLCTHLYPDENIFDI